MIEFGPARTTSCQFPGQVSQACTTGRANARTACSRAATEHRRCFDTDSRRRQRRPRTAPQDAGHPSPKASNRNWGTAWGATYPPTNNDGGGGNRTRVRGHPGMNFYKLSPRFSFACRLARGPPTGGLAILLCPPLGDWLSRWSEPVGWRRTLIHGRNQDGALPSVTKQRVRDLHPHLHVPGGFTRPTGDLGLQLNRRIDHVEARSPPYVVPGSVAGRPRATSRCSRREAHAASGVLPHGRRCHAACRGRPCRVRERARS